MMVAWRALWLLTWLSPAEAACSPTSFYKGCWIRRFPGLDLAVEESGRRGAALLQRYREESALRCSRACCLSTNLSCNLAVFHYNTTQDSANCFHLHCPTLESCILRQRGNVILYNVTKGVDPDLLVFGNHFSSNSWVLPNQASSRLNVSEPFASDKRQFNRPHVAPSSSTHPATPATSRSTPTTSLLSDVSDSALPLLVTSTQNTPPASSVQRSTLKTPTLLSSTHLIANLLPHTTSTTTAPQSSTQSSPTITAISTSALQPTSMATTTTVPELSSQPASGLTYQSTSQTVPSEITTWRSTTASVISETRQVSTMASLTNEGTWASTTGSMNSETMLASTTASTTNKATGASTDSPTSQSKSAAFSSRSIRTTSPLINTQQSATEKNSAHSTVVTTQLSSIKPTSASTLLTVKTVTPNYVPTTTQPQLVMTTSQATKTRPYSQPSTPLSTDSPLEDESTTPAPTTDDKPQVHTSDNAVTSEDAMVSTGLNSKPAVSVTSHGLVTTSLTPPTSMEDSQPYPNDTKGYISRNITTGDSPRPGGNEGLAPVWHLAANTVLVALATCATIAFGCCCSVLMAVSWRGRRRRKGRYRTTLSGKRGSMRLIKYVIVRESS